MEHVPYESLGVLEDEFYNQNHVITKTALYRKPEFPHPDEVDFLVIMGGPMGANDEGDYHWLSKEKQFVERTIENSVPVVGICLGAQIIASVLGAEVYPAKYTEIGWYPVKLTDDGKSNALMRGWPDEPQVFHWHGDTFDLPDQAVHLARSEGCENQAFIYDDRVLGLQFHVEMRPKDIQDMLNFSGDHGERGPYVQETSEIENQLDKCERINALARGTVRELMED